MKNNYDASVQEMHRKAIRAKLDGAETTVQELPASYKPKSVREREARLPLPVKYAIICIHTQSKPVTRNVGNPLLHIENKGLEFGPYENIMDALETDPGQPRNEGDVFLVIEVPIIIGEEKVFYRWNATACEWRRWGLPTNSEDVVQALSTQ